MALVQGKQAAMAGRGGRRLTTLLRGTTALTAAALAMVAVPAAAQSVAGPAGNGGAGGNASGGGGQTSDSFPGSPGNSDTFLGVGGGGGGAGIVGGNGGTTSVMTGMTITTTGTGGTGGRGTGSAGGNGGNSTTATGSGGGGGGGAHGSLVAAVGGAGGNGGNGGATSGNGGGGGAGGYGAVFSTGGTLNVLAGSVLRGGAGGNGGNTNGAFDAAGVGGSGGIGLALIPSFILPSSGLALTFNGSAIGGAGGLTGTIPNGSFRTTNFGGAGGTGLSFAAPIASATPSSFVLTNTATVTGGAGGLAGGRGGDGLFATGTGNFTGSNAGAITGGAGGLGTGTSGQGITGGRGGDGVNLAGGNLTNTGTISGGAGGNGPANFFRTGGLGGDGVVGSGITLTNSGTISGGAGGSNSAGTSAQGNALNFTGGTNTINQIGTLSGIVNVASGATVRFSGITEETLSNEIFGSGSIIKSGAARLTLSGSSSLFFGGTTIDTSTLAFSNNDALGRGGVSFINGSLEAIGSRTIANTLSTSGTVSIFNGGTGTTLALNGAMSGNGNVTFRGTGTTTLGISSALSTTGSSVTVATGSTLSLGSGITFSAASISVQNGATVNITGNGTLRGTGNTMNVSGAINIVGGSLDDATAINLLTGGAINIQGNGRLLAPSITLAAGTAVTLGGIFGSVEVYGNVSGAGSFVFGASANALIARGGTNVLVGPPPQASGPQIIAAGIVADFAGDLRNVASGGLTVSGVISGAGALTFTAGTGTNTTTLTANNTHSGMKTINSGLTLQVGAGGTSGSLGTGNVINNGALSFNRSDLVTVSNVISGTGNLVHAGTGSTVLSAANTYTGSTNINAGTLIAANANALGSSANGTFVASGATLALRGSGGTLTFASEPLTLAGTGVGNGGALRSDAGIGGTNIWQGSIALAGASRINSDAGALVLNGPISSSNIGLTIGGAGSTTLNGTVALLSGGLTKDGSGTLTMTGASFSQGITTVNAGTLSLTTTGSLAGGVTVSNVAIFDNAGTVTGLVTNSGTLTSTGALNGGLSNSAFANISGTLNGTVSTTGTLTLTGVTTGIGILSVGGTFNMSGFSTTVGSLEGGGMVSLGGGVLTIGTNGFSTLFTGGISGTGGITKVGNGLLTLSGINTLTGLTTVNGGMLTLSSNGFLGGAVQNNASFSNAGNVAGLVTNTATLTSTGRLNGGLNNSGTATLAGNVLGTVTNSGTITLTGTTNGIGAFVQTGGTFNLGGFSTTIGSLSGSGAVALGAATLTTGGNNTSTTFSGVISGNGGLTKEGTGTFTLSGANTYAGLTTVSSGTLRITNANALGATASGTIVANGATLSLVTDAAAQPGSNFTFANEALTLSGAGAGGLGALRSDAGSTGGFNSWGGAITLAADSRIASDQGPLRLGGISGAGATLTIGGAGNFTMLGAIALGNGGFVKDGAGLASFLGTNTYTGLTTVAGGSLSNFGTIAGDVLSQARFSNAGGSLSGIVAGRLTVATAGTAFNNPGGRIDGGVTVQAGGNFTSTGIVNSGLINAGTSSIAGQMNGAVTNNAGTITLTGTTTGIGAVTQAAGAGFNLAGFNTSFGSLAGAGNVMLGAATLTTGGNNTSTTFSGVISGSGGLTKAGTGTFTLSGANTYTGLTTVTAGTLVLTGSLAGAVQNNATFTNAGTVAGLLTNAGTLTSTGALNGGLNNSGIANIQNVLLGAVTNSGTITLTGNLTGIGLLTQADAGIFDFAGFNASIGGFAGTGQLRLGAGNLTVGGDNSSSTFGAAITGTGSLIKQGTGTFTLNGPNTFTGGTTIGGGTLAFGDDGALGTGGVTLSGGTLAAIGNRTLANLINVTAPSTIANGGAGTIFTINQAIGGTGDLSFTGVGTTVLAGGAGITGLATFANGLTLNMGANSLLSARSFDIQAGATVNLGAGAALLGTGNTINIAGALNISAGGTIDDATAVNLLAGGSLTYAGAGRLLAPAINLAAGTTVTRAGAGNLDLYGNVTGTGSFVFGADGATLRAWGGTGVAPGLLGIGDQTIAAGLIANAAGTVLNSTTGNLTIAGPISGAGSLNFATDGGSIATILTGANTLAGAITVASGTLVAQNANAIGAGGVTVATGATLYFQAPVVPGGVVTNFAGGPLTLTGAGVAGLGALRIDAGDAGGFASYAGALNLAGATLIANERGGADLLGAIGGAGLLTLTDRSGVGLQLSSVIGTGAGGVTIDSAGGNIFLNAANTYSGPTTVANGTLVITANGAVAGAVQNNATFFNQGIVAGLTTNAGTLNSTGVLGGGLANTNIANVSGTLTGAVINSGTINLTGATNGMGAVTQTAGAFNLAGFSTAIGSLAGAGTVTLGAATLTTGGNGTSTTFAGVISGTGQLVKTGTGTFTLTGVNSFTGMTTVAGGTLALGAGGSLAGAAQVNNGATFTNAGTIAGPVTNAGTFASTGVLNGGFSNSGTARIAGQLNGVLVATGGTVTQTGAVTGITQVGLTTPAVWDLAGFATTIGSLTGNGAVRLGTATLTTGGDGSNTRFDGTISGTGGLTKAGAGTFALGGANSFTGLTTVSAGTLQLLAGASLAGAVTNAATFQNAGTVTGLLTNSGTATNTGTLAGGVNNTRTFTSTGIIGTGLTNSGTASLAGQINGFLVNSGAVTLLGGLNVAGAVTQTATGTIDLAGFNAIFGSLAGAGAVRLGAGTLQIGDATSTSFAGVISGTGGLIKVGTGTLTLTGINTYTGVTFVNAGTLTLGAAGAGGNAAMATAIATAPVIEVVAPAAKPDTGTLMRLDRSQAQMEAISGTVRLDPNGASVAGGPATGALSGFARLDGGAGTPTGGPASVTFGEAGPSVATRTATAPIGGTANLATIAVAAPTPFAPPPSNAVIAGLVQVGNGGTFNNFGTVGGGLIVLAGGTANSAGVINGGANNAGTLVSTNELNGGLTNSGTARIAGQLLGDVANSGSITLTGITTGIGNFNQTATGTLSLGGFATTIATISGLGRIDLGAGRLTTGVNGVNTLFGGTITGAGGLTKIGTGGLVLTGDNSFTGGTTISAGTLQLGNGGTTGSVVGAIVNNGMLVINRSNLLQLDGVISGTGMLVQAGTGTTVLTGANSYTGGTLISAGRLVGNAVSLQGAIQNNAALEFNQAAAGVFAGRIAGAGTLDKTGAGLLELTGDNSGLTGATAVRGGELRVTGLLSRSVVTVLNGGTLSGNNVIGGLVVQNGATVSPGVNGIGNLGVAGNIVFQPGSTLASQVTPTGVDQLLATGTASLAGTLAITGPTTGYRFGSVFTLLQADGGRTGTFGTVTGLGNFSAAYRAEVLYTANQVQLRFNPNLIGALVAGQALTVNQASTAARIDEAVRAGYDPTPLTALYNLGAAGAPAGLDQLSGEARATGLRLALDDDRMVREAVTNHLAARRARDPDRRGGVWGQVVGAWGFVGADGNAARTSTTLNGFVAGLDRGDGDGSFGWRAGVFGFYLRNQFAIAARNSTGAVDRTGAGLYAEVESGRLAVRTMVSYAGLELETNRRPAFAGFADATRGHGYGEAVSALGEIAWSTTLSGWSLSPFLQATAINAVLDAGVETGGPAALRFARARATTGTAMLGLRFERSSGAFSLSGLMGARTRFADRTAGAGMALAAAPTAGFDVFAPQIDRVAGNLQVSAGYAVSANASVSLGYSGLLSSREGTHAARASFDFRF